MFLSKGEEALCSVVEKSDGKSVTFVTKECMDAFKRMSTFQYMACMLGVCVVYVLICRCINPYIYKSMYAHLYVTLTLYVYVYVCMYNFSMMLITTIHVFLLSTPSPSPSRYHLAFIHPDSFAPLSHCLPADDVDCYFLLDNRCYA